MKKIIITLLILCMLVCLVACGKDKGKDNEPIIPKFESAALSDWQSYTIVYPDGADVAISDAFMRLFKKIGEKYDTTVAIKSDFTVPSQDVPTDTLEILIGKTNREESQNTAATLKANDYVIKMENNRLVILGGSALSTSEAVDFYISYLMGDEGLLYPINDGVSVKQSYKLDTLTIGGVDISEFKIVRGSNMSVTERQLISLVQKKIAQICGVEIPIAMFSEPESEYEILFGATGREASVFDIPEGTASARQTDKKLAFYGVGENANGAMMRYFVDEILAAIPDGNTYDISGVGFDAQPYSSPNLVSTNLPVIISDNTGKYDADFTDPENVFAKFMLSVNSLPEEITVLAPYEAEDYPDSKVEIYVAPDGDDENDGSKDSPLATIYVAAKKLAAYNGGIVWVRGGIYNTTGMNSISVSGTAVSPIFIKAYADETPVFSAGKSIPASAFKPILGDDAVAARIPDVAKANVVYVNLFELGWTADELGAITSDGTPSLYVNGKTQHIARYPNADEPNSFFDYVYDTGSVTSRDGSELYAKWIKRVNNYLAWKAAGGTKSNEMVTYSFDKTIYSNIARAIADALKLDEYSDTLYTDSYKNKNLNFPWEIKMKDTTPLSWVNTGDIWYYGNVFSGWEHGYYNIDTFDSATLAIKSKTGSVYGAMHSTNSPTGFNTYYLFNAIEALDTENEYFIDRATGNMYIYKTEGFETAELIYCTSTKPIIELSKCSNVVIDGLTVRVGNGQGIYVADSNNIVIERCRASQTAKGCISVNNSSDCAIIYNDVSDASSSMISASSGSSTLKALTPSRNIVQNNYCHDPRASVETGIQVGGVLSVVSHNYLDNCKINIGTSAECIIEYNDISGGSRDVSDAGLVYLNGYYNFGNHIRYNYMHNWNAPGSGVYFDDLSSFNYAYYNIIDSTDATRTKGINMLYCSSGHANVFYANILVGRKSDYIHESTLYFDNAASLGYRFDGLSQNYVTNMSGYSEKFFSHFPEIREFHSLMTQHIEERKASSYVRNELEIYLRSPASNVIKNNVILGCNEPIYQPITAKKNSVTGQNMTHYDLIENNFAIGNPSWVLTDFENGDFSVLPDIINELKKTIPDFYPLTTADAGPTVEE